jgi:16S rRNA (adenine1518-N6/adenine1519-N6)-dimethyltransferase
LRAKEQRSLEQTKALLRRFDLRAKKGLGQHFLVDDGVLRTIIEAAELSPNDLVVEVGPGLGILTEELAKRAKKVIAIEVDNKLASALSQSLSHLSNLTIINADVLQVELGELGGADLGYKVVANLPYYIAAPVLRHFLESPVKPRRMVIMVQKEVAQSIAAAPGRMSILSIAVQLYGKPTIVAYVPTHSFYPAPKVDSAILSIDVYEQPMADVEDVARFFQLVRAGFSAPRKQLKNSLALGLSLPAESAAALLDRTQISPKRRAETLTIEEWTKLYHATEGQHADPPRLC